MFFIKTTTSTKTHKIFFKHNKSANVNKNSSLKFVPHVPTCALVTVHSSSLSHLLSFPSVGHSINTLISTFNPSCFLQQWDSGRGRILCTNHSGTAASEGQKDCQKWWERRGGVWENRTIGRSSSGSEHSHFFPFCLSDCVSNPVHLWSALPHHNTHYVHPNTPLEPAGQ